MFNQSNEEEKTIYEWSENDSKKDVLLFEEKKNRLSFVSING